MEAKKLLAEALGTFTLVFAVLMSSSATNFPIPVPVVAGLVVALFVYTIWAISGCHLNPAVTLGLLSIRKITPIEAGKYIAAQVVGALLALVGVTMLGTQITGLIALSDPYVFVGEVAGTALFTFGIASVVFGKISDGASGAVIGGSLILGAFVASLIGAPGFLNPAVALGAKSITLTTLLGPIMGGAIGMLLYKYLVEKS